VSAGAGGPTPAGARVGLAGGEEGGKVGDVNYVRSDSAEVWENDNKYILCFDHCDVYCVIVLSYVYCATQYIYMCVNTLLFLLFSLFCLLFFAHCRLPCHKNFTVQNGPVL